VRSAAVPEISKQFHLFPFLPFELREQIWKLAIRPLLPGAHVFRVYHASDTERANPEHATSRPEYRFNKLGWSVAVSRCLPRSIKFSPAAQAAAPISWTLNNPSAYLIDGGLRTTCKESLQVIEKEFRNPA
jgi:hypothetical protein